jgi:hypothetical protein
MFSVIELSAWLTVIDVSTLFAANWQVASKRLKGRDRVLPRHCQISVQRSRQISYSILKFLAWPPNVRRSSIMRRISNQVRVPSAIEEGSEDLRSARVFELPQRFGFDLPNALARNRKLLADFLERVVAIHAETEAHTHHALFACRQ